MTKDGILTIGELDSMEKRIEEINSILQMTDEADIHNNLGNELEYIIEILEKSLKNLKRKSRHIKIVGSQP
jgi:hypothetical protein